MLQIQRNEVIKSTLKPHPKIRYITFQTEFKLVPVRNRKQLAYNEVITLLQQSKQTLLTPLKQKYSIHTCIPKITLLLELEFTPTTTYRVEGTNQTLNTENKRSLHTHSVIVSQNVISIN